MGMLKSSRQAIFSPHFHLQLFNHMGIQWLPRMRTCRVKMKNIKLYFERENILFQVLAVEIKSGRLPQNKPKYEQKWVVQTWIQNEKHWQEKSISCILISRTILSHCGRCPLGFWWSRLQPELWTWCLRGGWDHNRGAVSFKYPRFLSWQLTAKMIQRLKSFQGNRDFLLGIG